MTNKKVIDILPPIKKAAKKERDVLTPAPLMKSSSRPFLKKSLVFILLILILAIALAYFYLPQAEIEIFPKTRLLNLETKLIADKQISQIDANNKTIPAQVFQKEKSLVNVFPASGRVIKEEKARGMIKVYNEYSTAPQILIAKTRFVSTDGKVFRTPVAVTVPGGVYEKGKLIPGEIEIEVVADNPGPEYNIGPSTFSIPGFAGTDKYTKFYAKSFQAMSGGLKEEIPQVTEEDLKKAEELLTKQAQKECEDLLKQELQTEAISMNFYYFPAEIKNEIIEKIPLVLPNEQVAEFKYQAKARCWNLIFKKEDLQNFAKQIIAQQILPDEKLYEGSLKIDYSLAEIDLTEGKIVLSLKISSQIYSGIDFDLLKKALVNKSIAEVKLLLEDQPNIERANVKFWPFWVTSVPEDLEKIKINLKFNSSY
ncbi:MAG: hypothetical protein ACPLW9_00190 [Minisyncoccales bacterium]